ncbi:MAG: AEC family transporter [Agathobacter sp.]|nr:AEC family transporter [Agathobacter sp.]
MNTLVIVCPVITMLLIGMFCKKAGILSRTGTDNIKSVITKFMLPTAVFHALAIADYSLNTWLMVGATFLMMALTFLVGFLLKPCMKEPYKKFVPFMVSVYEGGMIAYPLYTNLCGAENLSNIAVLDIAGCLFGFGIYMGLLQQVESDEKTNVKALAISALKTPTFDASILGVVAGVTGIIKYVVDSPFGGVYLGIKDIITASLTAMILIVVGFDFEFKRETLWLSVKTIFLRILVQGVFVLPMVWVAKILFPGNFLMLIAVLTFMSAPATFSMQSFIKDETVNKYTATTNSLYVIVSVAVYTILATWV